MLGKYKLNEIYNEDCYLALPHIPDNSIDLIYVDVPYLYKTGGAGTSEISNRSTKQKMELMGIFEYDENLSNKENIRIAKNKKNADLDIADISSGFDYKKFIKEAFRIMKVPNLFIWCSLMQINDLINELSKYTKNTVQILVWCKKNPIPATNNNWLSDIEYCLYIRDGIRLNDGYELKSKWYLSEINQKDKTKYGHPTIKPLNLVERHIKHTTNEGGVVLDCFIGSGTTAIACINTNRNYIGFELNKTYYKVAKDRLNGIEKSGQMKLFVD